MTKRELVWVLIRAVGAYSAYLAIVTFFAMLASGWGVIFEPPKLDAPDANANRAVAIPGIQPGIQQVPLSPNANQTADNTAERQLTPKEKARREAVTGLLWLIVLTLIYGGLGFYFLRDGRLLFALLMREESDETKQSEPEVTSLNL